MQAAAWQHAHVPAAARRGPDRCRNAACPIALLATPGAATPSSTDAATSPLAGKTVVVVGAGGAGRALAFGAAVKGARVVVANRSVAKAQELAAQVWAC